MKEDTEQKNELKVLTLNACLLPHYIFQSRGEDNREQRAMLIHQMVQKYDVVLLQEILSTFWCQSWKNMFKEVPHMNSLFSVNRGCLVDSGLVILSKYPITNHHFIPFISNKPFSNKIVNRGFLYASIRVNNKDIHVINTHLCPNEGFISNGKPSDFRNAQIESILEFKRSMKRDEDVWIIGGDFNTKLIKGVTFDESYHISQTKENTSHRAMPFCMEHKFEEGCIDYIVSNREQIYSRVIKNLISDHYPVESEVVII